MRFKTSYHPIVDAVLGIQAFSTICALQLIVYQGTSKYQMMVVVDLRTRDAVPFLANAILTERPLNATTTSDNPAYSTIASWTQKKRFARQIYWWSCFLLVQQQDLHAFKICWKMADKLVTPVTIRRKGADGVHQIYQYKWARDPHCNHQSARARSASAITGRRYPHSGVGEYFLTRRTFSL